MDIKTFVTCAQLMPPSKSILIRGPHGIGKSEVVAQLAKAFGLPLVDRRISQMTEGDLLGLPKLEDGVTRWCPPTFIQRACAEPVLLFLDEINRGTQEVMQACFQLVLDRQLGDCKLHPNTRVFAAVNAGGAYQVNEMDPAFIDRFWLVDLQPSIDDFFDHVENRPAELGGPLDADLIRFLKERPARLESSDANPGNKQPSRRSWVHFDRAAKAGKLYERDYANDVASKGTLYNLATGYVGLEAAQDLADYFASRVSAVTAEQVLDQYCDTWKDTKVEGKMVAVGDGKIAKRVRKLGQDKLNSLIDVVIEHGKTNAWTPEQAKNLGQFVSDLPGELRLKFITNFTQGLKTTPHFKTNFKTIHPTVMPHILGVYRDKKTAEEATAKASKK